MNIHPLGAQLILADRWAHGQTDMTELIGIFRNYANARTLQLTECKKYKNIQGCHLLLYSNMGFCS